MSQLSLALITLLTFQIARAAEPVDYQIHQHFVSPRSLASGGTFSGIDDYSVIFYNPAALARLKEGDMNFGIQGAAAPQILTLKTDIENASKNSESTDAMVDLIQRQYGKNYGLRFPSLSAIWSRPGWGIGIIPVDLTLNTIFNQLVSPAINVSAYQDTTVAVGFGKSYFEEVLSIGITGKAIYRAYVGKALIAADLLADSNFFRPSDANEGFTVDADIGLQYVPKVPTEGIFKFFQHAKPTFGAVVRNAVDYGFKQNFKVYNKEEGSGEPLKLQRRLDLGSRWDLPSFWVFYPKFMFDVRDIGHRYWTFRKGLHTGFELMWQVATWLRGNYSIGLGQGYLSAGVGAELGIFRLDALTFGEELGTTDAKMENRMYMLRMSLSF